MRLYALLALLTLTACASRPVSEVTWFEAPQGPPATDVRAILAASDGSLWVAGGGISLLSEQHWSHFTNTQIGLPGVATMVEGSDGSLWCGGRAGVSHFDGANWKHYGGEMGRNVRIVFSGFAENDGSMWFATSEGAVHFDGETWSWITTENGLRHNVVHAVHRDSGGDLWFATRKGGLSRLRGDDWTHFHQEDNIRAILADQRGHLWFGTGGGGVHQFDGTTWTRHYPGETVLPLFQDSRGNIWFSRPGSGTLRLRNGVWTPHHGETGEGEVYAAAESPDRGLWFGTDQGLVRLRKM